MATPILIDTDMGVDDAFAVSLALASDALDVRAVVAVGGAVELDQAVVNIGRLLKALSPRRMPRVGRGLQPTGEGDRRDLLGADGLGGWAFPADDKLTSEDFRSLYRETIADARGELIVLATGPLTNLAAIVQESPEIAKQIRHVYISGGAVWAPDDLDGIKEFNFHRDPEAAAIVLSSGLSITVTPLDVTKYICLDESHAGHLAASGYRTGLVLSEMLRYPLENGPDAWYGKFHIHDAVAAGSILWPGLYLRTRMRLEVETKGKNAGHVRPALGGDKSRQVDLLTAVNAVDFQENMLESLCHEAFVV